MSCNIEPRFQLLKYKEYEYFMEINKIQNTTDPHVLDDKYGSVDQVWDVLRERVMCKYKDGKNPWGLAIIIKCNYKSATITYFIKKSTPRFTLCIRSKNVIDKSFKFIMKPEDVIQF